MKAKSYARSVNVPFTGLLPEMLDFSKGMTTRVDQVLHYYNTFIHFDPDKHKTERPYMHMFWRNARTRHPEFYKIGVVEWWGCKRVSGYQLTKADAILDGFGKYPDPLYAYKEALAHANNLNMIQVDHSMWTQLLWDQEGWVDGPWEPPKGNPARNLLPRKVA